MSKLPSSALRSISVRQQPEHALPRLRKSASAYGIVDHTASAPVEIGSKGSIFSLVNQDITACLHSPDSRGVSPSKKRWNFVWHSRLWLMPRKANASGKHTLAGIETIVESVQETKPPKWKRLFKKLTRGSARSKGDGSIKLDEKTRANLCRDDTRHRDATNPAYTPPQKSDTPPSLIWERRSFAQISPLDFSHLYTAKIKEEHARLQ